MRVKLKSHSMAYDDQGVGRPILFIHGYPLNRQMWGPQINGLVDAARGLAPDLRGFGESDAVAGPYSMEMLADDCLAMLQALQITEPVVVCGLSMGGYIALALYRKAPQAVAGLILAATRAGPDSETGRAARDQAASLAREKGASAIAQSMLPKMLAPKAYDARPDLVRRVLDVMSSPSVEGIAGALMAMKERPDSAPLLPQIDTPTLILHGRDDQLIPAAEAEAMHAAIKSSRLELLPDAGHLLNLEQPEAFNRAVRDFVATLGG